MATFAKKADRRDCVEYPLVAQHARYQRNRDGRAGRVRLRSKMVAIDARASDHLDLLRSNPERRQGVAVLRVLYNNPTPVSTREAQRDAQGRPAQPRGEACSRKTGTQSH